MLRSLEAQQLLLGVPSVEVLVLPKEALGIAPCCFKAVSILLLGFGASVA